MIKGIREFIGTVIFAAAIWAVIVMLVLCWGYSGLYNMGPSRVVA